MAIARRIGAGVLLVLASLGLLFCVAAIVAVWVVRAPVNDAVDEGISTATGYLDYATADIQRVNAGLMEMQGAVDSVAQGAQQGQVAPDIATNMTARIERLSDLSNRAQSGLTTLEGGVNAVGRLPDVDTMRLESRLQSLSASLTQVQNRLQDVRTQLAQNDNARLAAASTSASTAISNARASLGDAQTNIAAAHGSLSKAQERIPRWMTLSVLALTLLFALLGAGQVSLIVGAWARLRHPYTEVTEPVTVPA